MTLKAKHVNGIRLLVLAAIFLAAMWSHYQHLIVGHAAPSVHAICPYGGLESLLTWAMTGLTVQKILTGTMALFFLSLGVALLFNRSFCGVICPFGALQEWLGLPLRHKLIVPAKLDRILRGLKYIVLGITVVMAWRTATLWMSPYDPWAALAHAFNPQEMWSEFPVATVLLGMTIVGSVMVDRFFCKYLCPAGALYALIGKISPFRVRRDKNVCIDCGQCDQACPMNITVSDRDAVRSGECTMCGRCVHACPQPRALDIKLGSVVVRPLVALALVLVVFFGGLHALDAAGLYNVSAVPAAGDTIAIQDLKGWMSITEGALYTGLSVDEFYEVMGIPRQVPAEVPLREIGYYVRGYDFHAAKAQGGLK